MATSTVKFSGSLGKWHDLTARFNVQSQSIANNETTFYYLIEAQGNSSNANLTTNIGSYSLTGAYSKSESSRNWSWNYNNKQVIASGTFKVSHNSVGVLSNRTLNFSVSTGISTVSSATVSITIEVADIPRASTIKSIAYSKLGAGTTIEIDRKVSSFTHEAWWRVEGETAWSSKINVSGTSFTFTIPLSKASLITDDVWGKVEVWVNTYNNGVKVGQDIRLGWIEVPDTVKPTVSNLIFSEYNTKVSALGLSSNQFVQYNSQINVEITGEAGIYGSTIKEYWIRVDGQVAKVKSGRTEKLQSTSANKIEYAVRDSRGIWSNTYSKTIEVLPYKMPSVKNVTFTRSNSNGLTNFFGTYVTLRMTPDMSSLNNKNKGYWILELSSDNGTSWTQFSNSTSEIVVTRGSYSVTQEYQFRLKLKDSLNEVSFATDTFFIRTGGSNLFVGYRGIASAFGKIPTYFDTYNLEIGDKGIHSDRGYFVGNGIEIDYPIETDSGANYEWEKWKSGKLIQKGQVSQTINITSPWGNMFYGGFSDITFPIPFITTNNLYCELVKRDGGTIFIDKKYNATKISEIYAYREVSVSSSPFTLVYYATGRWK